MAKARDATTGPSVRDSSCAANQAKAAPRASPMGGANGKGMGRTVRRPRGRLQARRLAPNHGATLGLAMDLQRLRDLLDRVQRGQESVDDAVAALRDLPFADLGYAMVDHHRAVRQGAPEVILGQGKTAAQIAGIANELART